MNSKDSPTIIAAVATRDEIVKEIKRLEAQWEGVGKKIEMTKAKLEGANEILSTIRAAESVGPKPEQSA